MIIETKDKSEVNRILQVEKFDVWTVEIRFDLESLERIYRVIGYHLNNKEG